jgi:hypothetical protein
LLDDDWDAVEEAASHAHTSCVGYPQDPQVPHPAAPEYADALASHQRCRQAIWSVQRNRGYGVATMTPEFGPDGYLHTLPLTNHPRQSEPDQRRDGGDGTPAFSAMEVGELTQRASAPRP